MVGKYQKGATPWPRVEPVHELAAGSCTLRVVTGVRGLHPHTGAMTGHMSEQIDTSLLAPRTQKRPAEAFAPERVRPEVQDLKDYFNLAAKKASMTCYGAGGTQSSGRTAKHSAKKPPLQVPTWCCSRQLPLGNCSP